MSDFVDIVAEYDTTPDLYAAVLRIEQDFPGELPVIIGLKAWALLDEQMQRDINDLLQALRRTRPDAARRRPGGRPMNDHRQQLEEALRSYRRGEL
ncbi:MULTISPECIES: hypothetical protein [unclassified Streptomyces]|uniref:hypothetical protein n=1 Tax=unclassified Streptomyces TaxID=2593676 RepID=UPI00380D148E